MTILVLIVSLYDHLRDVPWEDIFKISVSADAKNFCEWSQVENDVYIPHEVSGQAFLISHKSLFCLYQQNKSSESKVKFTKAHYCKATVVEAVKLAYPNKTKESFTSQKPGCWDFY